MFFQVKTQIVDVKDLRKYKYSILECRLYGDEIETLDHVLNRRKEVTRSEERFDVKDIYTDSGSLLRTFIKTVKTQSSK